MQQVSTSLVVVLFLGVILWYSHVLNLKGDAAIPSRWRDRLLSLVDLLPTTLLIGLVLGTIYAGWATPTESAALGVAGALVLALVDGRLNWRMLNESMHATARTTSMIALILFGAYFLNYILSSLGVPQMLAKFLTGLPLPGWAIMLVIIGFYLALGTFMEGMSMVITTIPLLFPVVKALGYDPIWFGVVITMLVEIAMISPPDGTVLYVLQGMRRFGRHRMRHRTQGHRMRERVVGRTAQCVFAGQHLLGRFACPQVAPGHELRIGVKQGGMGRTFLLLQAPAARFARQRQQGRDGFLRQQEHRHQQHQRQHKQVQREIDPIGVQEDRDHAFVVVGHPGARHRQRKKTDQPQGRTHGLPPGSGSGQRRQ